MTSTAINWEETLRTSPVREKRSEGRSLGKSTLDGQHNSQWRTPAIPEKRATSGTHKEVNWNLPNRRKMLTTKLYNFDNDGKNAATESDLSLEKPTQHTIARAETCHTLSFASHFHKPDRQTLKNPWKLFAP